MIAGSCAHRDIRQFDDLRCCLACGEVAYLSSTNELQSSTASPQCFRPFDYSQSTLQLKEEHDVRVAILHAGVFDEPVSITIKVVNLLRKPRYEAISYTWASEDGDDSKSEAIHDPHGIIRVTKNCEAALRRLRLRAASRALWIDAICINQSCVKERNHQVGLMDRIYRQASTVIICIQDPEHDYSKCLDALRDNCSSLEAIEQTKKLLRHRYFTRAWVIQEVVLAQKTMLQINNDAVIFGRKTRETLKSLCLEGDANCPVFMQPESDPYARPDRFRTVAESLYFTIRADASDERDIVYSITSLLRPNTRKFIPIDYSLNFRDVLCNAVKASIVECSNLSMLKFAWISPLAKHDLASAFNARDFHRYLEALHTGIFPPSGLNKERLKALSNNRWKERLSPRRANSTTSFVSFSHQSLPPGQVLPRIRVNAWLIDIIDNSVMYPQQWLDGWQKVSLEHDSDALEYIEQLRDDATKSYGGIVNISETCHGYVICGNIGCFKDDMIFAVDGLQMPLILRRYEPNSYRIRGTCYYGKFSGQKKTCHVHSAQRKQVIEETPRYPSYGIEIF